MKRLFFTLLLVSATNYGYSQSAYSQPRKYPEYVQPYDLGLIERGLRKKQSTYNRNVEIINNKVSQIDRLLSKLIENKKINKRSFSESQIRYIKNYYKNLKKIESWDFSSRTNTLNVLNWLKNIEDELYNWF